MTKPSKTKTICLSLLTVFLASGVVLAEAASYIDSNNRFILDGRPFFPIGLYVAQCPTKPGHFPQIDEIADSPFDTLMNYCTNTCDSLNDATDEQIICYLHLLQERNLKLIFSLREYIDHGYEDISAITHKVNTFKGHPAIIAWYMNDELPPEYLPQLEKRYKKVRELDENHPVWSVHWNTDWLLKEAHTTDVVGVDCYPIPHNPITFVSRIADSAKKAGKPLWLVPQIFDWSDYGRQGRPPTKDEMRAMTYLAVNHGAKGLIYYSYFNLLEDEFSPVPTAPQWKKIKDITSEIRDLRHVFLSTDKTNPNDVVCSNANIDFKLMRDGDTYYLFAVNTKKESINGVSFDIKGVKNPSTFAVMFERHREIVLNNAKFTDDFGPYEVHIYKAKSDGTVRDVSSGDDGNGDDDGGGCFVDTAFARGEW